MGEIRSSECFCRTTALPRLGSGPKTKTIRFLRAQVQEGTAMDACRRGLQVQDVTPYCPSTKATLFKLLKKAISESVGKLKAGASFFRPK